jgi:hypothetical protein
MRIYAQAKNSIISEGECIHTAIVLNYAMEIIKMIVLLSGAT